MHTRPYYTPPGLPAFRSESRRPARRRLRLRRGSVTRFGQIAVCLALITTLAADTVFACRWFVRRHAHCRPAYCQPVHCAPVAHYNGCSAAPAMYGGTSVNGGTMLHAGPQAPGLPPPPGTILRGGSIPWESVSPSDARGAGGTMMEGAGGRIIERPMQDERRSGQPRDITPRVDPDAIQRPRIDEPPPEPRTFDPRTEPRTAPDADRATETRTEPRTLPRDEPAADR